MKKKILWILGTLFLLLALLLFLFHTSFVKTKILNYINGYISRSLDLPFSAESLDYNLFTLRVSFKNVKAGSNDVPTQMPFFQAEAVELQLTPAFITRQELAFKSIRLVRPRVNVRVQGDGTFNIPPQLFSKSEEPPPPLHLQHITIEDGYLGYRDPAKGLLVDMPGISSTGVMISGGKQEFNLEFNGNKEDGKHGKLVFQDRIFQLEKGKMSAGLNDISIGFFLAASEQQTNETIHMNGRLTVEGSRFSLRELEIAAAGGTVTGTGEFYLSQDPEVGDKEHKNSLSLTLKSLNLQSPLLTGYIPHPLHTAISGSFDLVFPGFDFKDFRANAAFTFSPLHTPPAKNDHLPLSGAVTLKLQPGAMTIRDFNFTTPGNKHPGIPQTQIRGSLKIMNSRFRGELFASLNSESFIHGHLLLSGQINEGRDYPLIRARLQSKGIQVGSSMTLKPMGTLEYENGQFRTQNMKVEILGINSGSLSVSGILPLETPPGGQPDPLNITINAKNIDFKQLTSSFRSVIPVRGSLSAEAKVLPGRTEINLLLENCAYEQKDKSLIDLGNIDARLKLENNRLTYRVRAADLAVEITGSGRPEFPFPLQGTAYISSPGFETLSKRQGFAVLDGISGTLKGQLDYRLSLGNIRETASVDVLIDTFLIRTMERELENRAPIRFTYDRSGITLKELELTGPGSIVRGEGFLPMTDPVEKGLTLEAQVDARLLNPLIDSLKLQGDLSIRSRITGSVAHPVLSSEVMLKKISFASAGTMLSPAAEKGIDGQVDGSIKIGGRISNFRELSAEARFPEVRLNIPGLLSLTADEPVKLLLEKGHLRVEHLSLHGENNRNRLDVSGSADLTGEQKPDFRLTGQVETKLLNFFMPDPEFTGENKIDVRVGGKLRQPEISGAIEIQNNSWYYPTHNLMLNRLNGTLRVEKNRLWVEDFKGSLNGGPMTIAGEMFFDNHSIREGKFTLSAAGTYLEFPEGLFSETSGELHLTLDKGKYLLKGTIDINGGVYKESSDVRTNLFEYLLGKPAVREIAMEDEEGDFLKDLDLDIWLRTAAPVLIDNNITRSELTADLTLRGTIPQPSLSGRITSKEGGKIYLGGNTYMIESGVINFINPYRIEPDLSVSARTRIRDHDIVLNLKGTPQTFSASFNSTPALSEPDIIALLTTGRTLAEAKSSPLSTTGSHALSYINNTFTGKIRELAKQTIGLDNVRIDGSLIANRDNPGARITVGQRLSSDLELTLSQNLKDAQNRSWILDYTPAPNLSIQGIKQDKDRYTTALLREIRFGKKTGLTSGVDVEKKEKAAAVAGIRIEGDKALEETIIRRILKLRKGKSFNYFKLQGDIERIRNLYRRHAYLRAEVQAKQIKENGKITVLYTITAGPAISLDFSGDNLSRRSRKKAIHLWVDGRFDRQSIKNVVQFISNHFIKKGYYQVRVIAGPLKKEKDSMHQSFDIQKGTKYRKPLFIFQGNRLIPRKRLYRFLKALKLNDMVFTQPDEVARQLLNYYRGQGFMTARIGEPQIRFHPSPVEVTVTIPVSEGLLFKIAKITISGGVAPAAHGNNKGYSKQKKSSQKSKDFLKSSTGSRGLDETTLLKTLSVKKGQVFSTKKLNDARYEIAAAYTGQGYHNVRVTYEQHVSKEEGSVDLIFRVEEGPRGIIQEIEISGNVVTRMAVIRREITFKEGDVLDFREINKSRKKLYDLGIFKRVNIEIEDLPVDNVSGKRQRVVIRLLEPRPFQVKTGLQWNTETAFGAVLELNNANIAGKSHYSGTSFSIDGKESNFKTYYRFPYFLGKKMATEFYLFAGKKTIPTFSEKRRGFTVQQQLRPGKGLLFSWSYTWKRAHTFDLSAADFPPTGLEFKLNLAYVTTTFSYDRRNSLVNPTRGMFFSLSLQHAAALLGSDAGFSRLYGEYNRYLLIKGFLVGATSVKIGLGQGLGQANLPGERFYAGGSTTMRGFNKNSLGPLNPETGLPSGGEALFIFKQEIRARLHKLFSLVLFADLGNVYQSAADFDIFDVRKSIGFGIRLHIAPLLLRIDWGFKLDRRPDESPSHIYLSIGQAF